MADQYAEMLVRYATSVEVDPSSEAVAEARRRVLDSVGVALGACAQPSVQAVQRYAQTVPVQAGARIWGTRLRSSLETAALANGVAVRYLDYNDAYFGRNGLHPSDVISGLVAVAEWLDAPASDLLAAVVVAYEVGVTLSDAFSVRDHGWDHANVAGLAACCGIGRLMALSGEQLHHALAITVVSHCATAEVRAGHLAMWKAFAAPDAVKHAVYACLLARSGVTAPAEPFVGKAGFVRLLLEGEAPDERILQPLRTLQPPRRILDTHLKAWPVGYVAQGAVDAACVLRARLRPGQEVERITITTFQDALDRMMSPAKLEPRSRETADHSLPYVVAAVLRDGGIDSETFTERRFADPAMHAFLRDRVDVRVDEAFTRAYPQSFPARVEVRTTCGESLSHEVELPLGHARNPLPPQRVVQKFLTLAEPVLGPQSLAVWDFLAAADHEPVSALTQMLTPDANVRC